MINLYNDITYGSLTSFFWQSLLFTMYAYSSSESQPHSIVVAFLFPPIFYVFFQRFQPFCCIAKRNKHFTIILVNLRKGFYLYFFCLFSKVWMKLVRHDGKLNPLNVAKSHFSNKKISIKNCFQLQKNSISLKDQKGENQSNFALISQRKKFLICFSFRWSLQNFGTKIELHFDNKNLLILKIA